MSWADVARETGWLGVVWLAAAVATAAATVRAGRRGGWRAAVAGLHRDQGGAAYTLSYVMVAPLYLLLVCIVFETSLLLVAKVGTVYAAHAGARSAIVWSSAQPEALREKRVRQSVWTAMAPIVTLRDSPMSPSGPVPPEAEGGAADFADAYLKYSARSFAMPPTVYRSYTRNNPDRVTLVKNYRAAAARTTVELERDATKGTITATVVYRAPFLIPAAGRLFDPDKTWPYEYPIRSVVTLPDEPPVSASHTLGIDYSSAN